MSKKRNDGANTATPPREGMVTFRVAAGDYDDAAMAEHMAASVNRPDQARAMALAWPNLPSALAAAPKFHAEASVESSDVPLHPAKLYLTITMTDDADKVEAVRAALASQARTSVKPDSEVLRDFHAAKKTDAR
jgi:hypothetical protein